MHNQGANQLITKPIQKVLIDDEGQSGGHKIVRPTQKVRTCTISKKRVEMSTLFQTAIVRKGLGSLT